MQSTGPHTDVEDKANAKVYISNINKNVYFPFTKIDE